MPIQSYRGHSTQPAATLNLTRDEIESLAKQVGFIKRRTQGFSASGFLLSLLKAVTGGKGSLSHLATSLGATEVRTLTRQGLAYRFSSQGLKFMQECLALVGADLHKPKHKGLIPMKFSRVILQDATQVRLHPKNAKHYKGIGNKSGAVSCAKLDTLTVLSTGEVVSTLLTNGKEQDRVNGHQLFDHLKKGDLVLRDMGYFDVKAFARIEAQGAFWVSRLTALASVWVDNKTPIEELLRRTSQDVLDLGVVVTKKRHKCRLIAVRLPEEVANLRRAKAKKHRKKMGSQPRKESLLRAGWSLYLTNLDVDEVESLDIVKIYEQRWAIEIQFRALKGSSKIRNLLNCRANKTHLHILLTALMIYAQLIGKSYCFMLGKSQKKRSVSIEKVAQWLSLRVVEMRSIEAPLTYAIKNLLHEKRHRKPLAERAKSLF